MLRLKKIATESKAEIILKMESMEPCNSVKDRIGYAMINEVCVCVCLRESVCGWERECVCASVCVTVGVYSSI
jgi:hypothetical protein